MPSSAGCAGILERTFFAGTWVVWITCASPCTCRAKHVVEGLSQRMPYSDPIARFAAHMLSAHGDGSPFLARLESGTCVPRGAGANKGVPFRKVNAHRCIEQSWRDDLEAVGHAPWHFERHATPCNTMRSQVVCPTTSTSLAHTRQNLLLQPSVKTSGERDIMLHSYLFMVSQCKLCPCWSAWLIVFAVTSSTRTRLGGSCLRDI